MAKLIILIGAPGAGKTTFAKGFEGKIVSTDSIRKSLYGGESVEYSEEQANFLIKENVSSEYTASIPAVDFTANSLPSGDSMGA